MNPFIKCGNCTRNYGYEDSECYNCSIAREAVKARRPGRFTLLRVAAWLRNNPGRLKADSVEIVSIDQAKSRIVVQACTMMGFALEHRHVPVSVNVGQGPDVALIENYKSDLVVLFWPSRG